MSVSGRKPVGEDNDVEHHSRLVDRQHKNDNYASPMFAFNSHRVSCSSSMGRWWTMDPWNNCWDRRSQPQLLLIHNISYYKWQKDNMQQATHQTNISNRRCIHAITSHKTYTQTK